MNNQRKINCLQLSLFLCKKLIYLYRFRIKLSVSAIDQYSGRTVNQTRNLLVRWVAIRESVLLIFTTSFIRGLILRAIGRRTEDMKGAFVLLIRFADVFAR